MDPITAFAAAQAAVAGVKACVNLYKDAKAVGKDVSSIGSEITAGIGKFFEAQEAVVKAGTEIQSKVIKTKSVDMQAFDNIMRVRQLQEYEQELKELLIYHTPYAGLWDDFLRERSRLREEKKEAERAEKRKMEKDAKQKAKEAEDNAFIFLIVVTVIAAAALFFALIVLLFQ